MGFQFVDNLRACCYLVRVDEQFFSSADKIFFWQRWLSRLSVRKHGRYSCEFGLCLYTVLIVIEGRFYCGCSLLGLVTHFTFEIGILFW